jgi:alkylhydroperoxidase family enzyme
MMARSLPRTTAALLELDLVQRTKSPLDPKLRAAMGYVAAYANGCEYAKAYALADGRNAGLGETALTALSKGDMSAFSNDEKAALEFSRKMTVESSKVTDAEFAALVKSFGDRKVAAMVLLTAYANSQDRLLIVLGAPVETGGPLPPVAVSFPPSTLSSRKAPASPPEISDLPKSAGKDLIQDDPGWAAVTYAQLQKKLENQKRRPTRLRIPTLDEVMKRLPAGIGMQGKRVVWSLVAFGYCPELAPAWESLMWINGDENGRRFDRVFGLGLFWILHGTR